MTFAASTGWPVRAVMRRRDRLAQVLPPGRRRVMSIAGAQSFDGAFQHRLGRVEIGIADTQQYDVFAALLGRARRVMNQPSVRAVARDSLDQR